jgi:hypothetical protein
MYKYRIPDPLNVNLSKQTAQRANASTIEVACMRLTQLRTVRRRKLGRYRELTLVSFPSKIRVLEWSIKTLIDARNPIAFRTEEQWFMKYIMRHAWLFAVAALFFKHPL